MKKKIKHTSNEIGERIRALRKEADLLQRQAAKKIGVARTSWGNWERGLNVPEPENVFKIGKLFNRSPAYILTGETGYLLLQKEAA